MGLVSQIVYLGGMAFLQVGFEEKIYGDQIEK